MRTKLNNLLVGCIIQFMQDWEPGALALVLLRVSQDPSKGGRSIDGQRSDGVRLCKTHSWTYGEEYEDTASASEFGARRGVVRKDFERLLKDIPTAGARILIVAAVSRTSRDVAVLEGLRKTLVQQGMLWCIGGRIMDPAEPGDTMLILMEGVQAQVQALQQSKDLLRGVREARAAGRAPAGFAPFGFHRPAREIGQKVVQVPHPVNGPLVAWAILDALPGGMSLEKIGKHWEDQGEPSKPWPRVSVRRILQNPAVIGMTVHKGEMLPGDWKPLSAADGRVVTVEDFTRTREILSRPDRKLSESQESTSLLAALAHCECGGRVSLRRAGVPEPRYKCCAGPGFWPMTAADELVTLALFDEIRQAAARSQARKAKPVVDPRVDARTALAAAEAAYNELNENWMKLGLNLTEFAAAVKPLREQVQAARERLKATEPPAEQADLDPELYPALWAEMTLDQQRHQVRYYLAVTMTPGGGVTTRSNGR